MKKPAHPSISRALLAVAATVAGSLQLAAQATCDFTPNAAETVLDTNFGVVLTSCGPVNVAGGVYVFRNIVIPAGSLVRGAGTNPLVLIATGSVRIDGTLTVRGGNGGRVDTLNSANFPTPGGRGVCGGSDGGLGSPSSTTRSASGQTGWAFNNSGPFGGGGGALSCVAGCNRASGGGGGVFATTGDPYYPLLSTGTSALQQLGLGGSGCVVAPRLPGGAAGTAVFVDAAPDNDYFGTGVDLFARRIVTGELSGLLGGQGGGGGGDLSWNGSCTINDPNFVNDPKGGGGGAGGGVVVLFSLGTIHIGATGKIDADGGHGGGGEQAGSCNQGGGGGGGSGGMVVIGSTTSIEFVAHGETYANNDYAFAVSADGGAGTKGYFTGPGIAAKYPAPAATTWNSYPVGGLGGLGVVQLIVPFGNNADGTNTIFDDNVHVLQNGARLTGAQKQRYIAWRGYYDAARSLWVDDAGNPTNIGGNEGDIRPAPVLLPLF